jgi:F0F1-type ATP synthase delta subunit
MSLSRNLAYALTKKNVPLEDVIARLRKYNLLAILPVLHAALLQINEGETTKNTIAIESPFPLSKDALTNVQKIVGDKVAPHEVTINKNLLAGFKARYKGKLYDGSAERIIQQLLN